MIKIIRNMLIISLPYLLMISVNELMRPQIKESPYSLHGIKAMNSAKKIPEKCSWACHNETYYCIKHHVRAKGCFVQTTERIYFGAISALMSTGSYGAANLLLFVIFIPSIIFYCIIRSINIQQKIMKLKKNGNNSWNSCKTICILHRFYNKSG